MRVGSGIEAELMKKEGTKYAKANERALQRIFDRIARNQALKKAEKEAAEMAEKSLQQTRRQRPEMVRLA
jgi:hypothetical protein